MYTGTVTSTSMYKYWAKYRYMYEGNVRSKRKCESRYEYRCRFKSQWK